MSTINSKVHYHYYIQVVELKTNTIKQLNDVTKVNFEKNMDKITKIKEEFN